MPVTIHEMPEYAVLPSTQEKVVDAGRIIGWNICLTMQGEGIVHTKQIPYISEPDEIIDFNGDPVVENTLLESIIQKLEDQSHIFKQCSDELKAKIAAAAS